MRVHLLRHTRPDVDEGIVYGHTDIGVKDSFPAEAQLVREKIGAHMGHVVSSPLRRCRLLADALAGPRVQTDPRLKEMNFGAWENHRWEEIDNEAFEHWAADVVNRRCPGGESYDDLYTRSVSSLHDIRQLHEDTVTVVTHGGVVRGLLAHVLGVPLTAVFHIDVDFGSVTTLVLNSETARVACVNC